MSFAGLRDSLLDSAPMDLTTAQAEFLSEPNICVFATADARGRPHAVPVWYLHEDDSIWVMMGKGSKKHRNLVENRQVSLSFDQRTPPYFAMMISGPVELGEATFEDLLRIAVKYQGEEAGRAYAESMNPDDMVVVRLQSGRVVEHMAG